MLKVHTSNLTYAETANFTQLCLLIVCFSGDMNFRLAENKAKTALAVALA